MATPSNALPAEQRPIRNCGICSSPLCSHHVCRVCSQCAECDAIHLHSAPAGSRFLVDVLTDRKSAAQARRIDYLRGCGIAEEDFAEASRAVDNLKSLTAAVLATAIAASAPGNRSADGASPSCPPSCKQISDCICAADTSGTIARRCRSSPDIDRYESLAGRSALSEQVKPTP